MLWCAYTPLITTPVHGTHLVRVVYDWVFHSDRLGCDITVPAGFQFDWDSVPRMPIIYMLVKGRVKEEACAHDFLYTTGIAGCCEIERKDADQVMYDAMVYYERPWYWREMIYVGIRLGGWVGWNKYRKAEAEA